MVILNKLFNTHPTGLRPLNARMKPLPGLIVGLHPVNDRRRYNVTPFLIGSAQN